MSVALDRTEPGASHANSMAVVKRVCCARFNSHSKRGFEDRSVVGFVALQRYAVGIINSKKAPTPDVWRFSRS